MPLSTLPTIVTLILALAVATERFVEIVQGVFWQLGVAKENPRLEAHRKMILQGLAAFGGIGVTGLAWPVVVQVIPGKVNLLTVIALGLLASGGSGFWNTILTYVLNLKEMQKLDMRTTQQTNVAARPLPQPKASVLKA